MLKKIKYIMIFVLIFGILVYGFIKVSSELPMFIKDRSSLKVTYEKNPFNLEFDIGDYIIYINDKSICNIKDTAVHLFNNLKENISIDKAE
ncbi:hypothetical protein M2651_05080 [Clostridium sp. SYSU_GA19001]|uniref:hypothetical protein n=1 Tax=Clostridium caldaquaticum TaxID=2940653 RepID=UPI0020771ED2|nr:hypothetical protein [Clostridium caldaquaticum]MCM8710397.1 hypothetical protein [Clostridium caldaquaticum]